MNKLPKATSWLIVAFATLLLIIIGIASAKAQYHKIRDEYWGNSFPQHNPSYSNAIHIDTVNQKVYRYRKHRGGWNDETDRWSPIYLPQLHYSKPVDEKGFPAHENITLGAYGYTQEEINKYFPTTGATLDDMVDWAYLQESYNTESSRNLKGSYYINRDLVLPLDNKDQHTEGNRAVIKWVGGNGTMIKRQTPTDNNQALVHYGKAEFNDISLICEGANGMSLNSYYHLKIDGVKIFNADTGFQAIFCLGGYALLSEVNSSIHGFIHDYGKWAGGSNSASQSNLFVYQSCRVYAPVGGVTGFKSVGSSGTEWRSCVAEGHHLRSGFQVDGANSTVVKDVVIWSPHVEIPGGVDVAGFDVELLGGTVRIVNPFGQHPMKMVRAKGTQGYVSVFVEHCNWWVPDAGGKMFHSDGNVNWTFLYNDGQLHDSSHDAIVLKIDNYFSGENRGYCPTWKTQGTDIIPGQCGRDVWSYTPINR